TQNMKLSVARVPAKRRQRASPTVRARAAVVEKATSLRKGHARSLLHRQKQLVLRAGTRCAKKRSSMPYAIIKTDGSAESCAYVPCAIKKIKRKVKGTCP